MRKQVAVIGGGLAGLSAAIRLAKQDYKVTLYEQTAQLGGKMGEIRQDGFRFDTGPSLLTMPFVLDELFTAAGLQRGDFLDLVPVEPMCRYFFPDGTRLDASHDVEKMRAALASFSPPDGERLRDFLAYSRKIYDTTAEVFLFTPIQEWRKLLRWRHVPTLLSLPAIDPFRTVHGGLARFFKNKKVLQLFDRYATYNGSNPYQAPATLNIIPHVEYGLGAYYVRGGMYRLVNALEELARRLGVEIHTNTRVSRILQQNGRVAGIVAQGETITCERVVCNADVVTAFNELIEEAPRRRSQLNRLEPSLSGLVFLWGVQGHHAELLQHNIFFSRDYRGEFEQIFQQRRPPDDPTIYVAITNRVDAADAPPDGENWFVLLNMPYLAEGQDWEAAVPQMRETVLKKLRDHGIDLSGRITCERVLTPIHFYEKYSSNRGSIYGISSNSRSMAFRRPANRSRDVRGLYFAGGACHPGGGIPLVLLSGKMAAELLMEKDR